MNNNQTNHFNSSEWNEPEFCNPCTNCNKQIEKDGWFEDRGLCEDCEQDLIDIKFPPIYDIQDSVVQQNLIRIGNLENEKRVLMGLRVQTFNLLKQIKEE